MTPSSLTVYDENGEKLEEADAASATVYYAVAVLGIMGLTLALMLDQLLTHGSLLGAVGTGILGGCSGAAVGVIYAEEVFA